jgi:hypothetical protein
MKLTITLNGQQIKQALLDYIEKEEKFDISQYNVASEFPVALETTDRISTEDGDTVSLEFEKVTNRDLRSMLKEFPEQLPQELVESDDDNDPDASRADV